MTLFATFMDLILLTLLETGSQLDMHTRSTHVSQYFNCVDISCHVLQKNTSFFTLDALQLFTRTGRGHNKSIDFLKLLHSLSARTHTAKYTMSPF